ncbi:hypothetical protein KY358_06835 [Candidatus Woesearchaeota archaeon]|nr:hypothetical protein [Candidatus Woesearchaeota archaeon]
MADTKEMILQLIKEKGPALPADVARHIGSNILMASAHLSELTSRSILKISCVKVGGSPLYFIPGQESQLQRFSGNLHEKEKKAYDLLSQKKVLRDNDLEPVVRVALRAIKDYAVPLQVSFAGSSEIFWRWYLLANQEAEELIRGAIPEMMEGEEDKGQVKKDIGRDDAPLGEGADDTEKKDTQEKKITEQKIGQQEAEAVKEAPKGKEKETAGIKKGPEEKEGAFDKDGKTGLRKQELPKRKKPARKDNSQFMDNILRYFSENRINIASKEVIRKTEIDFIIEVPSAVGNLAYYCKAKNKKKVNDPDLAAAFAQGQLRKLPVLFLTSGELTKRAKEMLEKDFKGMGVRNV